MSTDSEFIEEDEARRAFTRRALLLGAGQAAAFAALGARLYQIQVMDGSRYAPLAEDNRISLSVLAPVRGRILDSAGQVLAANAETFRVVVDPSAARDMQAVIDALSRIVPVPADIQEQLLLRSKRSRRSGTVVAATDLTFEQVDEINLLAPQLPGVDTEVAYTRRYPKGPALAHVTGYVGAVDTRALDDDPVLRVPGMRIGKSGLERGMDLVLRGTGGSRRFEVDARGRTIRHLEETAPIGGLDVIATVDAELQSRVMGLLAGEKRAAAVVIEADTGEVVAMASQPSFDASDVSRQISAAAWRQISEGEHQPMLNRATSGLYPPGSIYKIVTALAGLEAGVLDPEERIDCTGSLTLADQTFRCWKRHGHGPTNLNKALRESCDVYFYEIARRCGIGALSRMARKLGFGEAASDGLALEKTGIVPNAEWKRWRFGDGWSTGDTILTGIGQGFALATPLQLAVAMARVATGKAIVPRFVRRAQGEAAEPGALGIAERSLAAVRKGLLAAVNEEGATGAAARLAAPVTVAGKTGTSQVRRIRDSDDENREVPWELRDHALFAGYFPAEKPRFVVMTVVEHGGGGGTAAAPLARSIMELLLADDPASRRIPAPPRREGAAAAIPTRATEG